MTEKEKNANAYFMKKTKKVYIDRDNAKGIETFEKYLSYRYRDECYYYSEYALMGLKRDDYLVRGYIDVDQNGRCNYAHGWVEFLFEDEMYVFDSMIYGVTLKEEWYRKKKPEVKYRKTQQEILDRYLNDKYAIKITERGLWQFKDVVDNDRSHWFDLNPLRLSRISIYESDESSVLKSLNKMLGIDEKIIVRRFLAHSSVSY